MTLGFVNAHTHLYSALAPFGLPAPEPMPASFVEILERFWWRLDRALDPDLLRAAARYYVADAVAAGTTGLIDHHESPSFVEGSLDVLADACDEFGLAAVLTYGATERNGGREEATAGLRECGRFCRENRRLGVRGVVGLHASFTVSDDTIREAGELARELGVPLHLHVAEDGADVVDARARGYAGVIDRLVRLDALPAGSILAHGVHLTRHELDVVASRGAWIVQNPRSNRGNRVGYPALLAGRPNVALGTDGYPSRMEEEVAAIDAEGARYGDDAASAMERLATSRTLFDRLLGVRAAPPAPVAPSILAALQDEARDSAARLAGRMDALSASASPSRAAGLDPEGRTRDG